MKLRTIQYDSRLLRGDPMLIMSMAVPFILWGLMQFAFPLVSGFVLEQWSYDLYSWYRQAGYFFMLLIPMMTGMAYGFILLDERDEGLITAISVTPMGKTGYLRMRLGIPLVISFIELIIFQLVLHLHMGSGFAGLVKILLFSSLLASQSLIMLLFLGAFAGNKIIGLAISKGFGILLMGPILDMILPGNLKWLGAYSPMFWSGRAFFSGNTLVFTSYFLITLLFQGMLILFLFRIFVRRAN